MRVGTSAVARDKSSCRKTDVVCYFCSADSCRDRLVDVESFTLGRDLILDPGAEVLFVVAVSLKVSLVVVLVVVFTVGGVVLLVLMHLVDLVDLVVALLFFLVLVVVALVVVGLTFVTAWRCLRRVAISLFFHCIKLIYNINELVFSYEKMLLIVFVLYF